MTNKAVIESLKKLLANNYALYLKTQNYHWNVTGPNFKPLHVLFEEQYNDLFTARRDWILGEKELAGFREDHKRRGPARFDNDNTKNYGWIFFITIIEIIANAVFLGGAHRDGPAGVFAEILMFGIINIGFSFILGFYIWRGFYHVSSFRNTLSGFLAVNSSAIFRAISVETLFIS